MNNRVARTAAKAANMPVGIAGSTVDATLTSIQTNVPMQRLAPAPVEDAAVMYFMHSWILRPTKCGRLGK